MDSCKFVEVILWGEKFHPNVFEFSPVFTFLRVVVRTEDRYKNVECQTDRKNKLCASNSQYYTLTLCPCRTFYCSLVIITIIIVIIDRQHRDTFLKSSSENKILIQQHYGSSRRQWDRIWRMFSLRWSDQVIMSSLWRVGLLRSSLSISQVCCMKSKY